VLLSNITFLWFLQV